MDGMYKDIPRRDALKLLGFGLGSLFVPNGVIGRSLTDAMAGTEGENHLAGKGEFYSIPTPFSLSHRKANSQLDAWITDDALKNNALVSLQSAYKTLQSNAMFKKIVYTYFENDLNKLTAKLLAIMIWETDLKPTTGGHGEKGYFQLHPESSNIKDLKDDRGDLPDNLMAQGVALSMDTHAKIYNSLMNQDAESTYHTMVSINTDEAKSLTLLFQNKGREGLWSVIETIYGQTGEKVTFDQIMNFYIQDIRRLTKREALKGTMLRYKLPDYMEKDMIHFNTAGIDKESLGFRRMVGFNYTNWVASMWLLLQK